MKSIKQQFEEFRSTTPKRVQWLLLAAAFVVVIILIVLLLGHKASDNDKIEPDNTPVEFSATPTELDLTDVFVGQSKNQDVNITVNTPVVVDDITIDTDDISTMNNCTNLTDSCLINVIYKPTKAVENTKTVLTVSWHVASQDDVVKTYEIPVVYGAQEKIIPEPVVKPEPEPIPEPEPEPEEEYIEPDNTVIEIPEPEYEDEEDEYDDDYSDNTVMDEIRSISNPDVFQEFEPEPEFVLPPEKCSDFAIPGYNQSGVQIGWIKPEGGANYFHPFSDVDCSNPTGRYDFATGVITSLKDGSRMGTDANHIGYRNVRGLGLNLPQLSEPNSFQGVNGSFGDDAVWAIDVKDSTRGQGQMVLASRDNENWNNEADKEKYRGSANDDELVFSSRPYDRTFILRQFKPIPATIVSEVRADPSVYGCNNKSGDCDPSKNHSIPVRATVDRNVFSDDGRTIIIPTGTLLMGYLSGELPGPYQSVGRMNIKWYQFIRPDGVEFNFQGEGNNDPYSADAQGRVGVPGHGSTDYIEQMVMPILTSLVPAAVNMIAPIADTVINQIDLDNNTIVQSGTVRSSEMAKQEVISTWNKVAQKLLVDVMANTTPPFSIAAGTRINVYSPVDLAVTCGDAAGKKCHLSTYSDKKRRTWSSLKGKVTINPDDASWVGQVRSFNLQQYCNYNQSKKKWEIANDSVWAGSGYDYRTIYAYCEAMNYEAINNAKQKALYQNQQETFQTTSGGTSYNAGSTPDTSNLMLGDQKTYNEKVLGLTYNDDGTIQNPFDKKSSVADEIAPGDEVVTCDDGGAPDMNGCCAGETFTDMGDAGWNCCPNSGGDCFPPITVE